MTAFKPGFRMIAGDPMSKKNTNKASICHRCLGNGEGFAPCDAKDTAELPAKYCPKGIRATIIFPSCWDGKNLDSPVSPRPGREREREKKKRGGEESMVGKRERKAGWKADDG
ncbi:hypothetical protein PMIN05_010020 [Paraphaeosphaeria minitans]